MMQSEMDESASSLMGSENSEDTRHEESFECSPIIRRMLSNPQLLQRLLLAATGNLKNHSCKTYFRQHPTAPMRMGKTRLAIDAFFTGAGWATEYLWPIVCIAMLSIDTIMASPRLTIDSELSLHIEPGQFIYDSSLTDIWLSGLSQNQEPLDGSLTSTLGVNRPDTLLFWIVFLLPYTLPSVFGLINMFVVCSRKKSISTLLAELGKKINFSRNTYESPKHQFTPSPDTHSNGPDQSDSPHDILDHPSLTHDNQKYYPPSLEHNPSVFSPIPEKADREILIELEPTLPYAFCAKPFSSNNAMPLSYAVALIVLHERFWDTNLTSDLNLQQRKRVFKAIKRELTRFFESPATDKKQKDCCASLAGTSYEYTSSGNVNRAAHVLFPVQYLIVWYFRYMYVRIPVLKVLTVTNYYNAMNNCKSNGDFYSWEDQYGDYACLPTNMTFVDLKSRSTALGSLNRLLSESRSASFLQTQLSYFLGKLNNVTQIDFSRQNWTSWSGKNLTKIFNHTLSIAPELQALNLSTPDISLLNNAQFAALAQFLSELTNLKELDLSGVTVNNTNATSLPDSLSHLTLSHLVLARTELSADTVLDWLEGQQSSLESLKLSSAYLYGGEQWPVLPQLQQLAIVDSVIDTYFYHSFTDWLNTSKLESLRLNLIDLSPYDLSPLFRDSSITALDLSSCMLTDYSLKGPIEEDLESSNIASLDLSENRFNYFGEDIQFPNSSNLRSITLRRNDFTSGMTSIIDMIRNYDIEHIDLSMTSFAYEDRYELFQAMTHSSSIKHLLLAGMDLSDAELKSILNGWKRNEAQIETLDLSSNSDLSNTSLSLLMAQACSLHLNTLLLTGVDLSQQINATIWAGLLSENCNLLSLNIEHSQASDANFRSLMRGLTITSPLKQLNVAENALNKESWKLATSSMLFKPSYLRGISEEANWDYNRNRQKHCLQNNNIELFVLSNSGLSGDNLGSFCANLNVFKKLNISAVGFGSDELRQSANTQIPGCPAAIETTYTPPVGYRAIQEIQVNEYTPYIVLAAALFLPLVGFIVVACSSFIENKAEKALSKSIENNSGSNSSLDSTGSSLNS